MSQTLADRFIAALRQAEESHDPTPLVGLFAAESECQNLTTKQPAKGPDGARNFWAAYLDSFASIKSDFHNVISAADHAVLEWTSTGALPTGKPITYRGVSVLQFDGDKVSRFHTYYDSAAFVSAPADTTAAAGTGGAARQGTPEPATGTGGAAMRAPEGFNDDAARNRGWT